jgi:hypothetical protein
LGTPHPLYGCSTPARMETANAPIMGGGEARGLQDDFVAIKAGLTLEWSNGVTEGEIHRLKRVKRQSYGRAGFALFRQRVLLAA